MAIRIPCPVCGALAGERCVDHEGHLEEEFHARRRANARWWVFGLFEPGAEPDPGRMESSSCS